MAITIKMKKVRYVLILAVLASLGSCVVRKGNFAASHCENKFNNGSWVLSGYLSAHPRPPIN
jgi:hypothetical protein